MIVLNICSVGFFDHIDLTDPERGSSDGRPVISFSVFPNENNYIEFETGEIFSSGGFGEHRDANSLECTVSLMVSSEQREPTFYYHKGGDTYDSSLSIQIPLLLSELDFIIKNIQSGIFPVTMDIDWHTNYFTIDDGEGRKEPENIIEYGRNPDGSHQIWKNTKEENRSIKLTSVLFHYFPLPAKRNEEGYLLKNTKMTSELSLLCQSIEGNFEKVRKSSSYILVFLTIFILVFLLENILSE